ncbi:MAG: alpha-mannosidase, partial [Anaerolineaceae bacterium]|nr:alpha-mannosidase [Anaerolineaceae bacterium]
MPDFIPYTRSNLDYVLQMIGQAVYTPISPLEIQAWRTKEPVAFADRQSGKYITPKIGDSWGELFDCAWFHFTGKVPAQAAGLPVVLRLDVNGEMLVVDGAGNPLRG